jgi:hypothetical protein
MTAPILTVITVTVVLLPGRSACAKEYGRSLSENGHPLQLQVFSATVTSKAQTFKSGTAMPGLSDVIASGGGTYRGPVENIYEQHTPGSTEIFLILEFKIAGVARTLQLAPGDVTVLDGKVCLMEHSLRNS